jgi:MFS transporter, DHA1 family, multidrug resistance protein
VQVDHRSEHPLYTKWLIFIRLVAALGPISTNMYLPGFPVISAELAASQSLVQYTVTAFLAGVSITQLLYGALSDRVGRKGPLCIGIALYIVASVGCGLAENISSLIGWRFVQGAGIVIGRAMVRGRFDPVDSAKVFLLLMLVVAVGPMFTPLVGGWMTGLGWRAIFATLALFGALFLVDVLHSIDETLPATRRTGNDTSTVMGQYWTLLHCSQLISTPCFMQSALLAYVVSAPSGCAVDVKMNELNPRRRN